MARESGGMGYQLSGSLIRETVCTLVLLYILANWLTAEGILWFHDLVAGDPYCALPVIVTGLHLLNIELSFARLDNNLLRVRLQKFLFRALSLLTVPFGSQLPSVCHHLLLL